MKKNFEIVASLDDSSLLPEGTIETIQNETNKQGGWFIWMLLDTLGPSLLGNILADKGINRGGKGVIRAGYGNKRPN